MAPPPALSSLKTEKGLEELNKHLADKSYIGGAGAATAEDVRRFGEIGAVPDQDQFQHVARWYRHIAGLKASYAEYHVWPGADGTAVAKKGPRAAGKEKKEVTVDCKVVSCEDRTKPGNNPPCLGAGSVNVAGLKKGAKTYYVTTAINYANGWPHIGHAYEALAADWVARWQRMFGNDTYYLTGSDEHGAKIAAVAEDEGIKPIEICDRYVDGFKALNQRLCISNDAYVRTTSEHHKNIARKMWETCKKNGDIYLDRYEGWYLVREERYVTDQEATEWEFKDPGSGVPLKKMSEPSFFFRLSKYAARVLEHFEKNEDFIQPAQYRKEMIERLKGMGDIRDLSISRGTFEHGVTCPEDLVDGNQHVMYVWFDALCNYFSAVEGHDPNSPLNRFWPADVHIIGKDITWFHTVIWPAMLMSAGFPLPKCVAVHGFISGADGRKMSKTYGNVINPHDMLDVMPCDTLRWYMCRESAFGDDIKFSVDSLKLMHNADLCDNLGNLVNRAVNLSGGTVPEGDPKLVPVPFDLKELKKSVKEAVDTYRLSEAADMVVSACKATNKWIADLEPWKMKDEDKQPLRAACCRQLLEAVYVLAHFFAPYIPGAADAIFKKVGTAARAIPALSDKFTNLTTGVEVVSGAILFEQLEIGKEQNAGGGGGVAAASPKAAAVGAAPKAKADAKAAAKGKEEKKAGKGAPAKEEEDPDQPLFSKLDIRVGKIVKAWHHPEADKLFVEEIDLGEGEPRQIVSGLREVYTQEEFEGKTILVVCNMKPAKMRGVMSSGMVLCAKQDKTIELIQVPANCKIGDRLLPENVPFGKWSPVSPDVLKKKKIWESVAEQLKTDSKKVACFDGKALVTEQGVKFLAPTLAGVPIS